MSSLWTRLLAEPEPAPWLARQSWHPWLVVGLVCIGAFVGQLDATIVQLALPTLGRTFGAPLPDVSWVALAYLLAFASFLPIFGRLCAMFGRKTLYIAGYALFILASALCGFAGSLEELLVYRFLQGIGGSLLGANSIAILVKTVPADSRGRALGYFAAAQAVGMSAGPAIGGLILASLGWQWIFWITVPFGIVAIVAGWLALPRTADTDPDKRFDWGGALMIGPAIILAVTALNHGPEWGLASSLTLGSVGAAIVLVVLLVRRERGFAAPLIDPRLFRSAAFCSGAVAVALGYALLYGIFFLMAFALQHGYGESPTEVGFRLALIPVALGLTAPFSSQIKARIGDRRIGLVGMLLCLGAVLLLIATSAEISFHRLFHTIAFLVFGVGLGLFIAPNTNATIAAAPAGLSGPAGSLLNLMRALGSSLGVAAGATTLAWRLREATGGHGDWLTAGSDVLLAAVRGSLPVLAVFAIVAAVAAAGATPRPERARP